MIKNMIYTLRHIVALNKTAKRLGAWHWRFLLHDVDKLFCYILFSKEITHKIHRTFSFHHPKMGKFLDPVQTILDWECARETKPHMQETAREWYNIKGYNDKGLEEALDYLGL